jgi:hypothetical protein
MHLPIEKEKTRHAMHIYFEISIKKIFDRSGAIR